MATADAPPWSALQPEWLALLARFLALRPFSQSNPAGVAATLELLAVLLEARGFTAHRHANPAPGAAGVLVAVRAPRGGCAHTVGLFGHVDVEEVADGQEAGWVSGDPLQPRLLPDGRYYCRGIGDNLGPLLARLLAFDARDATSAGVVWVVHGEEEVGSPFAHEFLPELKAAHDAADGGRGAAASAEVGAASAALAAVQLWLEETGYFSKDGAQRVLVMHAHDALGDRLLPAADRALRALEAHAARGRPLDVQRRFLNKGVLSGKRCPCVTHLVDGAAPYLSFGINDARSSIHAADESVPADTLPVAHAQFRAVLSLA